MSKAQSNGNEKMTKLVLALTCCNPGVMLNQLCSTNSVERVATIWMPTQVMMANLTKAVTVSDHIA